MTFYNVKCSYIIVFQFIIGLNGKTPICQQATWYTQSYVKNNMFKLKMMGAKIVKQKQIILSISKNK